jgi:hypothetical protein
MSITVSRGGEIRLDGHPIGWTSRVDFPGLPARWKWRAEVGDPAHPKAWPRYRASYGTTRAGAVAGVLEGLGPRRGEAS